MSTPGTGKFICKRAFWLAGDPIEVDRVLTLDDPELISTLAGAGKIEAADRATAERLRIRSAAQWSPAAKRPGRTGFIPSDWG